MGNRFRRVYESEDLCFFFDLYDSGVFVLGWCGNSGISIPHSVGYGGLGGCGGGRVYCVALLAALVVVLAFFFTRIFLGNLVYKDPNFPVLGSWQFSLICGLALAGARIRGVEQGLALFVGLDPR